MMAVYRIPVPAPSSQPCFFPLLPEIIPPININKNASIRIIYDNDASVKEVKRNKIEKIKLNTIIKMKIVIVP